MLFALLAGRYQFLILLKMRVLYGVASWEYYSILAARQVNLVFNYLLQGRDIVYPRTPSPGDAPPPPQSKFLATPLLYEEELQPMEYYVG